VRFVAALLCAIALPLFPGCVLKRSVPDSASEAPKPLPRPPGVNPLAGKRLWIDPDSNARRQAAEWRGSRPADAAALDKIASQPQAEWFGDWNTNLQKDVSDRLQKIVNDGGFPVAVVYNIPHRDCGQYSAGGAGGAQAYRSWIRQLAVGIGSRPVALILEPDALGLLDKCLSQADQAERLALLRDAVRVLRSHEDTVVYIDGGNANWIKPPQMAERLRAAGVLEADGFALNVSNYISNAETIRYGEQISGVLGGAHFVVDTSRNGNGATPDFQWCNPDGRALGTPPTTETGNRLVDAFLWVKRPGESDGTCNGGPKAGAWWPEQALGLEHRAKF
jgi:endoglucanase